MPSSNSLNMHRTHPLVGLIILSLLSLVQSVKAQGPGTLDQSWGEGGMVVLPLPGYGIGDIAVQADGKLVIATIDDTLITPLIRLLPDGSLDTGFGVNGLSYPVQIQYAPDQRVPWALAIDDLGRILITGTTWDSLWMARMLPDGSPDLSFGPLGYFAYHHELSDSYQGTNITFDSQGRILLGALEVDGSMTRPALIRVLPSGVIDSTFGVAGRTNVPYPPGSDPRAYESCLTPSGSIFTVGFCQVGSDKHSLLGKMLPDGMPDLSFGSDGYILPQFGPYLIDNPFLAQCHMLAPDRILLNTRWNGPAGESEVTALLDSMGNYVQDFGQNGRVWTDLESTAIVLGPQHSPMEIGALGGVSSGELIVNCNSSYDRIRIGRRFTSGELDTTFGVNGVATIEMAGYINVVSLALDHCRIYVGFRFYQDGIGHQPLVVALDGCGHIATAVNETREVTGLHLYPNPAQQVVRVELATTNEQLWLNDAMGRTLSVPVSVANGSALVHLGSVPDGVYTITTDHGRTSRLLVQH